MSQHDMDIANASGSAVRTDINLALGALVGQNSGATEPATTFAYMLWADTANNALKQRNAANSAWVSLLTLSTGLPLAANNAVLNAAQSFTAAQRGAVSALTYSATVTPDLAVANNYSLTLTGNATLANPTNQTAGQGGVIVVTQDGTGSRTLAYGSNWKFAGGTAPALTTTASAVDVIAYQVESATRITARMVNDVK